MAITEFISQMMQNPMLLVSTILTLGVIYVIRDFIAARAQLVTFILFILEIYFIEMFLLTYIH